MELNITVDPAEVQDIVNTALSNSTEVLTASNFDPYDHGLITESSFDGRDYDLATDYDLQEIRSEMEELSDSFDPERIREGEIEKALAESEPSTLRFWADKIEKEREEKLSKLREVGQTLFNERVQHLDRSLVSPFAMLNALTMQELINPFQRQTIQDELNRLISEEKGGANNES